MKSVFDLRERTFATATTFQRHGDIRHRSLGHALAASGARLRPGLARARGLLHHWFSSESHILAAFNMTASFALLAAALTMTLFGKGIAERFGVLVPLNESVNLIAPYAGVVLLSLGSLRLLQHVLTRNGGFMRLFGFIEAGVLLAGGAWAEAVAW